MYTIASIAKSLNDGTKGVPDIQLAAQTGLTRQSVSRARSGKHNFNVTTLLAIAEAAGLEVLILPRDVAKALRAPANGMSIPTMIDDLKNL
jgi:DNA-binding phage protein